DPVLLALAGQATRGDAIRRGGIPDQPRVPDAAAGRSGELGLPPAAAQRIPGLVEGVVAVDVAIFVQGEVARSGVVGAGALVAERIDRGLAIGVDRALGRVVERTPLAALRFRDALGARDIVVGRAESVQPAVEVLVLTPLRHRRQRLGQARAFAAA